MNCVDDKSSTVSSRMIESGSLQVNSATKRKITSISVGIIATDITCPVCFELYDHPLNMCNEGHLVCMKCGITQMEHFLNGIIKHASCPICRRTISPSFSSVFERSIIEKTKQAMFLNNKTQSCNKCSVADMGELVTDERIKDNAIHKKKFNYFMAFNEFLDWCIEEHFHMYSGKIITDLSKNEYSQALWDFARFTAMGHNEFMDFLFNRNEMRKMKYSPHQWDQVAYHVLCRGRRGALKNDEIGNIPQSSRRNTRQRS